MHPIALQIGSLVIRWYGVMAAVGFVVGCALLTLNRKFADLSKDQASNSLLVAMIAGIVGARIFYVIQFWEQFQNNLGEIIRIDHGGLVFYGGFILAIASLMVFCRLQKIDMVRLLDVYTPAIALAHACGRIGCFLNGCCFGKPTDWAFGVCYPSGSEAARVWGDGVALHPVQLYEAGENILVCLLMMVILRKAPRGVPASLYLIIYGLLRFVNEFFRGDNAKIGGLFTIAQVIGLILIPVGGFFLIGFWKHEQKTRV